MSMEHELWSMGQESHRLLDLRRDARGAWADEAAREITRRYLDPHQCNDEEMLKALAEQFSELTQAEDWLRQADDHGLEADRRSAKVRESLEQAQAEITTGWRIYESYVQYEWQARERLPRVRECIDRANNACG